MARKLKIVHIAKTKDECKALVEKTVDALKMLNQDIQVTPFEIRASKVRDHRCEIHISKVNGVLWNDYYKAINAVKAVPYDFV